MLGAVLVHNDAFETAREYVKSTDLFRDAHRRIFAAMERLHERRVAVDFTTLREELKRGNELDDVGGPAFIASLADGVPRATNVKYYAQIVKDKSQLREIIYAANRTMTDAYLAEEPPDEILRRADLAFLELQHGVNTGATKIDAMAMVNRIEGYIQRRGQLRGIDTGFPKVNEITLGYRPSDLNIWAAGTSMGKSSFIQCSVLASALAHKTRTLYFSPEMSREQLENRALAMLSGIPSTRIEIGAIAGPEHEKLAQALEKMNDVPIFVDDRSGISAADIRRSARRMAAEGGVDQIVVDYIQQLTTNLDRKGANRNEQLAHSAQQLKTLAKEMHIPVHVLSQVTTGRKNRYSSKPELSDLRDCGALEELADNVAFLWRKRSDVGGKTELIFKKMRNGPSGTVYLWFDRDTTSFTECEDQAPDPEPEKVMRSKSPGRSMGRGPRLPSTD